MIKNKFTVTSDGLFSGYAYVFNLPPVRNEVILPGAFKESIEAGNVKLLWDHNESEPIGAWVELKEDRKGLFVRGQLNLDVEKAREIKSLMEQGAIDGLSIGFTSEDTEDIDGTIYTSKVRLWEISVVTFPAMEEAVIDSKKSIQMFDAGSMGNIKRLQDGRVAAVARVARTGIQEYRGYELGMPEKEIIRVYRSEDEVFHRDSMKTYAHCTVTNDHPSDFVNRDNWKDLAIGNVGEDVIRDGEFVRVPVLLLDGAAIDDFEAGKRELSMGYTAELDFTPGVTKDGKKYDAVQRKIRINHLALVDNARGGPQLRIGDKSDNQEKNMSEKNLKTVIIDGVPTEMTDLAAQMHERETKRLGDALSVEKSAREKAETSLADVSKQLSDAQTTHKTAVEAKDAEIATLKKQLEDAQITPKKLDELVKDRATAIGKAKALIGDKLVIDGKSIGEIQRQVVDAKMGDTAKGWSDEQVASSFNTLAAAVKATDSVDPMREAIFHTDNGGDSRDEAYDARDKRLKDAWRKPAPEAARQ